MSSALLTAGTLISASDLAPSAGRQAPSAGRQAAFAPVALLAPRRAATSRLESAARGAGVNVGRVFRVGGVHVYGYVCVCVHMREGARACSVYVSEGERGRVEMCSGVNMPRFFRKCAM
jgi:hypothetical protein